MSDSDLNARHYFYHLRFELYPTNVQRRITSTSFSIEATRKAKSTKKSKGKAPSGYHLVDDRFLWVPSRSENIFDTLPGRSLPGGLRTSLRPESECVTVGVPHITSISGGPDNVQGEKSAFLQSSQLPSATFTSHTFEDRKQEARNDWRYSSVTVCSVDMQPMSSNNKTLSTLVESSKDDKRASSSIPKPHETRARVEPLRSSGLTSTELGWGIVHLYREDEESLSLARPQSTLELSSKDEDTTILCIPAVPSYMTPSDFLGWAGEKTIEQVSNVRFVMTGHLNRYLVLMNFRNGTDARNWQRAWDGKLFGGMEPESCHVIFIRDIVFDTPSQESIDGAGSFPDTSQDPFIPNTAPVINTDASTTLDFRPLPPPTSSLLELPTCPVCLERMDSATTGLLTILCRHIFHCTCLQKWRGSGCPVCRHVQPSSSHNLSRPFGSSDISHDFCARCETPEDLWICLICGNVGCGRYKGGHAKEHWKDSAHCFALEIETQHVWDYAGDAWVHRLIQTKGDGKLVELPSNTTRSFDNSQQGQHDIDMVPREKLDGMGMEYTHLLTSQLESQRIYFETQVKKAVDKASMASEAAEAASIKASTALTELSTLRSEHDKLSNDLIGLEKERDRLKVRAEKSAEVARKMTTSFQEEKQVSKGLLDRIDHINANMTKLTTEVAKLKAENEDLKEQNRDLGFFISSQEKLAKVEGQLGEEIREGNLSLPEKREPMKFAKGKGRK